MNLKKEIIVMATPENKPIVPEEGSRQGKILKEYELMARGYDTGSEECGWNAPNVLAQTLDKMGMIKPGMDVVDFAVGTGALTGAFRKSSSAGQSLHITATDLSPAMLEKCREKGEADELIQQDITKPWSFPKHSKDIVAATGVAEYLTDAELAAVIKEAGHTLKSGGILAFTFLPAAEGTQPSKPDEQQQHQISYVRKLFEENGIELQSAEEFDAYRADDGSTVKHVLALGTKC